MTRVTLGKSRVREIRPPGSVRAKAEWLSYSTGTELLDRHRLGPNLPDFEELIDSKQLYVIRFNEPNARWRSLVCTGVE